jgi:hypothetical protein
MPKGKQKPSLEEGQTTQWPKEDKGKNNNLQNTKQIIKDRATQTTKNRKGKHFLFHLLETGIM